VSEPEQRVVYVLEETRKDAQEWRCVDRYTDCDYASQKLAVLRESRAGLYWDFRLVQVDEVRTVIK